MSEYTLLDPSHGFLGTTGGSYAIETPRPPSSSLHPELVGLVEGVTIGFSKQELTLMTQDSALARLVKERNITEERVNFARQEMKSYVKSQAETRGIRLSDAEQEKIANFLVLFAHKFDRDSQ